MGYSQIKYLQTVVNLSNIKHLTLLDGLRFETIDLFKEILKSTTQLTSLKTKLSDLICWFDNDELCKYLNKYIKRLNLSYTSFENSDQLEQFCRIFFNLEQLKCSTNELETIYLIKYLPKLTYIRTYRCSKIDQILSIRKEIEKLGLDITASLGNDDRPYSLIIWINRN
ncbi:unnamed protein product [Adineta steineri]|uniref:Uncharacterized protein n=1 Tax=Adineta steineri TaxID=433720 RepID=A0A814LRS4_9BILA|nr:unnamed protein product [Adineta steineri]CAF3912570.1 unnamed protein product [Adineta steineri]